MTASRLSRRRLLQAAGAATLASGLSITAKRTTAAERPSFNPAIDVAWQAGLQALKPSTKELEHGLRLHAESLIFDVYGFSPLRISKSRTCRKTWA
jgi:membrane dipeptidase